MRVYSPWAVLHARRRGGEEEGGFQPRLAVVAGKRFPNAVTRNRARRLLRATTRVALGQGRTPWDFILVARTELLTSKYPERLAMLQDLLRQAGAINEINCQV